jgi:transcriptional regulator with XRE-family HTH domain
MALTATEFVAPTVIPTGAELRRIRRERGLLKKDVAASCSLNRVTVSRAEAGDASLRVRLLVAAALGIEVFPTLWRED